MILTAERKTRILTSILECDTYIAKEERRSPDLRPADIADLLSWTKAHRQRLIDMLASNT